MLIPFSPIVLSSLAFLLPMPPQARAATAGSFASAGSTLVSAMMMFLGNNEKVYILDKAEGNAAQVNGHPAWGAVWDIATQQATVMDVASNTFCASGMHLPNGSYAAFGGNSAVNRGGGFGSQKGPDGVPAWDAEYQDFDGSRAIRILNPCKNSDNFNDPNCQWFDNPQALAMQKRRWYSSAEALADGTIVLIGGFVDGGYINRQYPNVNPAGDGAEATYEFFPSNGRTPTLMQFMITTSGLNAYAHAFLLGSGKMFVQANVSAIIWDYDANVETPLPDMPGKVIRVYPASGAVAMLPLTPANKWNPTILFCGGSDIPDEDWGNYAMPNINTWNYPASKDCQRITPEPTDGSKPDYEADDLMLEGRTMSQFIILPDATMLVINGGLNGTAGYGKATGQTPSLDQMPFGPSLASGPVFTPAIYHPNAPKGQRWSNAGLSPSKIPRLYHSSAMLLPDGSVFVAGSNPNPDVNTTTIFPTEYRAEVFYPPYFSASTRPAPQGIPNTISYGGPSFDVTVPSSSYSGSANAAAANTTVVLLRGGFTTHAMNMGQRYVQLNNTFTVRKDGSYVLHVAQAPPNPNLLQPGPALLFVTVHGIPSNGTMVIVGNGQVGKQPLQAASDLPQSVLLDAAAGSSGTGNSDGNSSGGISHAAKLIGAVVGVLAVIGLFGALGICLLRRRRGLQSSFPSSTSSSRTALFRLSSSSAMFASGGKPVMQNSGMSGLTLFPSGSGLRAKASNESGSSSRAEWNPYYQPANTGSATSFHDAGEGYEMSPPQPPPPGAGMVRLVPTSSEADLGYTSNGTGANAVDFDAYSHVRGWHEP